MGQKKTVNFDWDLNKDLRNQEKHSVAFSVAQYAFPTLVVLSWKIPLIALSPKSDITASERLGTG